MKAFVVFCSFDLGVPGLVRVPLAHYDSMPAAEAHARESAMLMQGAQQGILCVEQEGRYVRLPFSVMDILHSLGIKKIHVGDIAEIKLQGLVKSPATGGIILPD